MNLEELIIEYKELKIQVDELTERLDELEDIVGDVPADLIES